MFKEWKYLLIIFLFGFFLSFLLGLIAGNPFFVILYKSIISGLLLGLIGFGANMLLRKYFPELFSKTQSEGEEITAEPLGEEVDIVLPEENPHEITEEDMVEDAEPVETVTDKETITEQKEKSGTGLSVEDTGSDVGIGAFSEGEEGAKGGEEDKASMAGDAAGLESDGDNLPDFDSIEVDVMDNFSSGDSGRSKPVKSDVLGTDVDPETLAKAVRSFMKKDEEG